MYRTKPLFPYIEGRYSIMPPGLPEHFYPNEETRFHKTENYVICFDEDVSNKTKQRFVKDYAEYYKKQKGVNF